ncbi:MAG TPA: 2OG-Fe(II) oxygenase [Candidatus Baltobacteraceae bacterium]|nr:2OG-Fe(II) oxygenase [Candidatus Baltobacteraceae bacterium]
MNSNAALQAAERDLLENGYAHIAGLLDTKACAQMRDLFDRDELFRKHIVMERHNFGKGEYKYFSYPLHDPVAQMREQFYAQLSPVANEWNARLRKPERFPDRQQQFLEICREHEQTRPTALLLRYRAGDYNCLHEDTYGEIAFPFQMTIFLSERSGYEGGEFVLVEQRPRAQSRPIVLQPEIGDALIIPNRYRPVAGKNGYYRTAFRHGVSEIRSGERYALGLIFHDAR